MSLEKQYNKFVFECDGDHCHESLETDETDFSKAQAARKAAGWAVLKDGSEWLHFCPDADCKREYAYYVRGL